MRRRGLFQWIASLLVVTPGATLPVVVRPSVPPGDVHIDSYWRGWDDGAVHRPIAESRTLEAPGEHVYTHSDVERILQREREHAEHYGYVRGLNDGAKPYWQGWREACEASKVSPSRGSLGWSLTESEAEL